MQDEEAIEVPLPFELEDRFMVIGVIGNKLWSAIITYRADVIRIISVRRSRKQELDLYDNSRRIR